MQPGEVVCDICSEVKAVKFCQTCSVSYCETDVKQHYTVAALKKHSLVEIPDEDQYQRQTSVEELPSPSEIQFLSVTSDSVSLSWSSLQGVKVPQKFRVTWECDGEASSLEVKYAYQIEIDGLKPGENYEFSVTTEGEDDSENRTVSASVFTAVPAPRELKIDQTAISFTLYWSKAEGMEKVPQRFLISYCSPGTELKAAYTDNCYKTFPNLQLGTEYTISVSTVLNNGKQSEPVSTTICTILPAPDQLTVDSVDTTSAAVSWNQPPGLDQTQHHYQISYQCPRTKPHITTTSSHSITLSDLKPATQYSVTVCTVLENEEQSPPVSTTFTTRLTLQIMIDTLGLGRHLINKLTPEILREIDEDSGTDKPLTSLVSRRLLKARSLKCDNGQVSDSSQEVNPLDLITALFLCSDGLLQQEMALKMSMCQFAVPLLLPNCDTEQTTLMLWAMRDIFVENSIVLTDLPMVSFVRLGNSTLSKSQLLNEVLSNSQNYNTFVHKNMPAGNIPRMISDGFVEMSWYLPSGNPNIDVFIEPVAVANLHGDIRGFQTQFAFLCQTSAAVFVFWDDLDSDSSILNLQKMKDQLFIVCNSEAKSYDAVSFEKLSHGLQKHSHHILMKNRHMNDAQLVKKLHSTITDVIKANPHKKVEGMSDDARKLGIHVDEDYDPCLRAKTRAALITDEICCIPSYKDSQLPLQGEIWKILTTLEKEECKLQKGGDKDIEMYKKGLKQNKRELRKKQLAHGLKKNMSNFIDGLKSSREERNYFLKWMKLNLDNLSRTHLSKLRKMYKERYQHSPERKDLIGDLNKQISDSSLGTEHFLREVGQLYESSWYSDESGAIEKHVQELPRICAQLMLDGFPLELMDGDASNIPMMWISDVLQELHSLTKSECKIRVVSVLGVQSSGKSTLLNTMFGVQFAVSSGRCTRGAFMLLIKVKEEFKNKLQCDFIMVIDTEGLKALQSTQPTDNFEYDNELATLLVGLSDISIVNIAMENTTDMKDTLQIVAHAFLRMKELGKKPSCQLVHQNVADIAAHGKNLMNRKHLLEQLNEMTIVASRMENTGDNTKFTDIIDYNLEDTCYIPGLWHGSPPMAPVNEGYSEAVADLKKKLINAFKKEEASNAQTFPEFQHEIKSLWTSVKYENFIFSFRNSVVAEAYTKLCVEFDRWDRAFQKHMYTWLIKAETRVANYGIKGSKQESSLDDLLNSMKREASDELDREGNIFLNNVNSYYNREEGNVGLVEKYRSEFLICAKSHKNETESDVRKKLEIAVDIKKGTIQVDYIKKNNRDTLDKKVSDLDKHFSGCDNPLNNQQLEEEFDQMWNKTVGELPFRCPEKQNITSNAYQQLHQNMARESGTVLEMLAKAGPLEKCGLKEFQVKSGHNMVEKFVKGLRKRLHKSAYQSQKSLEHKTQMIANNIIEHSRRFVMNKVNAKTDYHSTYITELLELIEEDLKRDHELHFSPEFYASLKIHICGHAVREFQQMHDAFISNNDPQQSLEKLKPQFLADFKDLFYKRDQCKRKAEEFTKHCLEPAVKKYITKSLGPDIYDEMRSNCVDVFSTKRSFQCSMLKRLLCGDFQTFLKYTDYYEGFVFEFILNNTVEYLSKRSRTAKDISIITNMEVQHLKTISRQIKEAVEKSLQTGSDRPDEEGEGDVNFNLFIQNLRSEFSSLLVIPTDTTGMTLENSKTKEFSDMLLSSVEEMESRLSEEFHKDQDMLKKLSSLPDPPQEKLFNMLFGCGRLCPFCKAPCDEEMDHSMHSASIHRPDGLGGYQWNDSDKLSTDICSSLSNNKNQFRSVETKGKFCSYKKYQTIFRDWNIKPDITQTAADYWKFLFVKYNEEYAGMHEVLPADVPEDWRSITMKQAEDSLKLTFDPKPKGNKSH
ncbi:unnamed protein product, partial [Oncorhynchus mykiss]